MEFDWRVFGLELSLTCSFLTIAVYLFVKKLRNTLGKCIISSLFSMVMGKLILILRIFGFLEWNSDLVTLCFNYFVLAYIIWLSVISFHMSKTFKTLNTNEDRYQFLVYSAFVWTTAAMTTGLSYLLEKLSLWNELGWVILSIFNFIMFILTAIRIWKVKRELKMFKQREETTTTCLNFDTQTFLIFLRMSIMRGVSWIFLSLMLILECFEDDIGTYFLFIYDSHLFFGIFVFILLIYVYR